MISRPTEERIDHFHTLSQDIRTELGKIIVGQQAVVDSVLICLLAGGHALLEGVPGLGKTELVKTLGEVLDLQYGRIQFTPDLMPADITGTTVIAEDQHDNRFFRFEPGLSSTTWCWRTRSTALRPKRSPRCWRPCTNAR